MKTIEERFWSKVDKTGDCWLWTAARSRDGYGQFKFDGQMRLAHRVVWTLSADSPPPAGIEVCHKCDNPSCVNPEHLFLDTHLGNMQDMVHKKRSCRGSARMEVSKAAGLVGARHYRAKLNEDDVREIRRAHAAGESTIAQLSLHYSIAQGQICGIVKRNKWKHVI